MICPFFMKRNKKPGSPPIDPREKRRSEFVRWLTYFQEEYFNLQAFRIEYTDSIENIATKLVEVYFNTLEDEIRGHMEDNDNADARINRHKMMSLAEMTVMYVQPINHEDEGERLLLNGGLATYIAKSLMIDMINLNFMPRHLKFDNQHIMWLAKCDSEHYPIFSNSHTWLMFEQWLIQTFRVKYVVGRIFKRQSVD